MFDRNHHVFVAMLAGLLGVMFVAGCDRNPQSAGKPNGRAPTSNEIIAASYPLQFLAQAIVGDALTVVFPVPEDADPHHWNPADEDIERFQRAALIVINGGGGVFAPWIQTITLAPSRICETIEGLGLSDFVLVEDTPVHTHGPQGEHSHSGIVPDFWMDPVLASYQAEKIAEALRLKFPQHDAAFANNLTRLKSELSALAGELESLRPQLAGRVVLTATPRYKYFTRRAGIEDVHFHWAGAAKENGANAPDSAVHDSAALWEAMDKVLAAHPSHLMIWPREPSPATREQLQQRKLEVVVIDLMDHPPASGNYLSVMRANIQRLQQTLPQAAR